MNGTFVFGADSDTMESFPMVRDFVLEHKVDVPRFANPEPLFRYLPTPKGWNERSESSLKDWTLYDGQHVVFRPKNLHRNGASGRPWERVWKEVYLYSGIRRRMRLKAAQFPLLFRRESRVPVLRQ